jgi:hypothetical protein
MSAIRLAKSRLIPGADFGFTLEDGVTTCCEGSKDLALVCTECRDAYLATHRTPPPKPRQQVVTPSELRIVQTEGDPMHTTNRNLSGPPQAPPDPWSDPATETVTKHTAAVAATIATHAATPQLSMAELMAANPHKTLQGMLAIIQGKAPAAPTTRNLAGLPKAPPDPWSDNAGK